MAKHIVNTVSYTVDFWWCEGTLHRHKTRAAAEACERKPRVYVGTKGTGGHWVVRDPS